MSSNEPKPGAALFEGLLDADGLGVERVWLGEDPLDEGLVELLVSPMALACEDVLTVKKIENKSGQTYPESIVGLIGGGVDSEDHTSFTVTMEKEHQQSAS